MLITMDGKFFYVINEGVSVYGGGIKFFEQPEGTYYLGKGRFIIDAYNE